MSFFKSNPTTTNATANEANQETTNNNGGLLKGIAIGLGTVAGIGAAYFGHKVYKSHHVVADENNLEDAKVDDDETVDEFVEVTENNETVESFNEVETEEPANEAPVETEAKTEETTSEAPVDEHSETEELVNQLTEEASKCASIETASSLIASIKKMDEMVGSVAGMYRTIGDNAKIDSAIAKLYKAFNSYWNNLDAKISNCDKETFATYASEIDDVNNAWWDMHYIQMNRIATETMSYVINKYAHMERVAKRKEEKAALAAETQAAQKSSDETQAEEKKSAGETKTTDNAFDVFKDGHKESNKVERETKSSTKASDKKQTKTKASKTAGETKIGNSTVVSDDGETVTLTASVSQESIDNVNEVINIVSKIPNRENPELNDMAYFIRVIGGRIHGIKEPEATFIAYDEASNSNKFIDACTDICNLVGKGICNLANSGKNPLTSMQWIDRCTNELVASGIIDNTYNPNKYRSAILKAHNEAMDKLSKLVSNENQVDTDKVTGETNTVTNDKLIDEINTYVHAINVMAFKDFTMISTDSFVEKIHKIDECISLLNNSEPSKAIKRNAYKNINITVRLFCTSKLEDINACASRIDIVDLCADVRAMLSLNLTNVEINETTLNAINNAITSAQNKADEIAAKYETKDLVKTSDETQADASSSNENQVEEPLTYTMSEKIQEAVTDQQSDETAATAEPESSSQAPMSPEASNLAAKLQEVGALMRAEKWSDAAEFYKTQLTPYLADDGLTKELREEIMGIKTKATNMMMSQKQLEAKKKAASAKASKKSNKRRRH